MKLIANSTHPLAIVIRDIQLFAALSHEAYDIIHIGQHSVSLYSIDECPKNS